MGFVKMSFVKMGFVKMGLAAKTTFVLFTAALLAGLPISVHAADTLAEIGLTASANKAEAVISSPVVNVSLNYGGQIAFSLYSPVGFTVSQSSALYLENGSYNSYGQAKDISEALGGIPAFTGTAWTVLSEGVGTGNRFVIKANGVVQAAFSFTSPPFIQGEDGVTSISGKTYRGYIKPVSTGSGVTLVNVLDAEQYLYSVVPSEMPGLWHIEALKAQAVAARTYYRYTRTRSHAGSGYELCDSIHCQVYNGTEQEHPNSTAAVNQTNGIVIYYNNEPIDAVFSSSSGGHTEDSENVWSSALPYLRGVKEVAEKEFRTWSRTYTFSQLTAALAADGGSVGTVTSVTAVYRPTGRVASLTFNGTNGSKTYQKDAIRSFSSGIDSSLPSVMFNINGYGLSGSGTIQVPSTTMAQTSPSEQSYAGEVSTAVYVSSGEAVTAKTSTGLYSIDTNEAQTFVLGGAITALSGDGTLKAYRQNAVSGSSSSPPAALQNTAEGTSFTITTPTIVLDGKGYGHGAGMSQYGAKGMADEGYTFMQILKHYYTGVDVK